MPENDITELQTLDIYQLTESQYAELLESSEFNPDALYMTPALNAVTSINGQTPDSSGNVNLVIDTPSKFTTCTLPIFSAAGSKAVTVTGVSADSNPILDVYISSASDVATMTEAWSHIYRADTSANTITFYSDAATSVALTVMVKDY